MPALELSIPAPRVAVPMALLVWAAWALVSSIALAHCGRRPNEHGCRAFAFWSETAAWALATVVLLVGLFGPSSVASR